MSYWAVVKTRHPSRRVVYGKRTYTYHYMRVFASKEDAMSFYNSVREELRAKGRSPTWTVIIRQTHNGEAFLDGKATWTVSKSLS